MSKKILHMEQDNRIDPDSIYQTLKELLLPGSCRYPLFKDVFSLHIAFVPKVCIRKAWLSVEKNLSEEYFSQLIPRAITEALSDADQFIQNYQSIFNEVITGHNTKTVDHKEQYVYYWWIRFIARYFRAICITTDEEAILSQMQKDPNYISFCWEYRSDLHSARVDSSLPSVSLLPSLTPILTKMRNLFLLEVMGQCVPLVLEDTKKSA